MIIGITGFNGAGKTTVVEHLEKKGFHTLSFGDILREILRKEGKEGTPENLQQRTQELRDKYGLGVLGELVLKKLNDSYHYVLNNIQHINDVEALQTKEDFILVHIDAPAEIRLDRLMDKRKEGETSYDDILAFEKQELDNEEQYKAQINGVARMANIVVMNDEELEVLYGKIDRMVNDLYKKYGKKEPSWDSYYMDIAQVVAKRSKIMNEQSGSVLVKDKRVLTMGYVDTPRGIAHEYTLDSDEPHITAHSSSEENVIVQAAYHGLPTQGATLYTTGCPNLATARMIINAGITKIVYNMAYAMNDHAYALLQEGGVELVPYTF